MGSGWTRVSHWENRCSNEVRPENGHAIRRSPAFLPKTSRQTCRLLNFLSRFAEKKKATPAQISLAWLLAQKPFIVPIPGTRNIDHLNENLGAINVQITSAELREIDAALSKIKVHGGRMNEEQMKVVDQTA